MNKPVPFEETDPELADLLKWHANSPGSVRFKAGQLAQIIVKVGRNDPCPCGSGKKFKKCCVNS